MAEKADPSGPAVAPPGPPVGGPPWPAIAARIESSRGDAARSTLTSSAAIDATVKLAVGLAALLVPLVAYLVQQRLTGTTLLSQREMAESQLRATMFNNLIQPFSGKSDGTGPDADRERLLVELLALNFHEHIELKPLLLHADSRFREKGLDPADAERGRSSLRSTARRVASRQTAYLLAEGIEGSNATGVYKVFVKEEAEADTLAPFPIWCVGDSVPYEGRFELNELMFQPPDSSYVVGVTPHDPNWDEETVKLSVRASRRSGEMRPEFVTDFTLTWYDFPLTDNTLLRNGNRFSITLNYVSKADHMLVLNFIWFPKGYFTPRERPVNYRELQELVGKKPG